MFPAIIGQLRRDCPSTAARTRRDEVIKSSARDMRRQLYFGTDPGTSLLL